MTWAKIIAAVVDILRRVFATWEQAKAEQRGRDEAELEARRKADADRAAIDAARDRLSDDISTDPYNRDNASNPLR
jgi:hypothetical protein